MNKRQKEVEAAKLAAEEKELKHLRAIYSKASEDIQKKIRITNGKINLLLADIDNLDDEQKSILQSQIYQRQFQESLQKQIENFTASLDSGQYKSINEYLQGCYETGYIGTMYDIAGQGIPLTMPIDQKKVAKAMVHNTKLSTSLYKRLGVDLVLLKKRIANNISRGIATASGYASIARNIAADSKVGFNRAMRIARTEGHRIQIESAVDAQYAARDAGADIVKQWDAALDGRTRPHHRQLDGQIRELDEPFEVNGMEVMYPSGFGRASEDINCRCALLQRARWALDEEELNKLKERAAYYGLDKTKDFEDYKAKYLKLPEKADIINVERYDVLSNTQKLKGAMSSSDYDEYIKILTEHSNTSLQKLYAKYADLINAVQYKKDDGYYSPSENRLVFSYPLQKYIDNGRSKYHTLAHEYGHFFDKKADYERLHFREVETIYSKTKYQTNQFAKIASSSDEFLAAVRKDRQFLKSIMTIDLEKDLRDHDASCGVQDAIDGLLAHRIKWGHGDRYYNRKYNSVKQLKEHKGLQEAYKELGIDASNLKKVANECRVYESASEMWANIMSAEVNGGSELEYVKKYLPNSYEAFIEILKGVK